MYFGYSEFLRNFKCPNATSIHCCSSFLNIWPVRTCQKYVSLYVRIRRQKRVVRTYVRIVVYTYLRNLCHFDVASANLKLARHYSRYGKWRSTKRSTTFGWMSSRFQDKTFYYTRFTSLRASQEILPLCVAKIWQGHCNQCPGKKHHLGYRKKFPNQFWVPYNLWLVLKNDQSHGHPVYCKECGSFILLYRWQTVNLEI